MKIITYFTLLSSEKLRTCTLWNTIYQLANSTVLTVKGTNSYNFKDNLLFVISFLTNNCLYLRCWQYRPVYVGKQVQVKVPVKGFRLQMPLFWQGFELHGLLSIINSKKLNKFLNKCNQAYKKLALSYLNEY